MKQTGVFVLTALLLIPAGVSGASKFSRSLAERITEPDGVLIPVIVLLEENASLQGVSSHSKFRAAREYSIIKGFSAKLSREELYRLSSEVFVKKIFLDDARRVLDPAVEDAGILLQSSVDSIGARYVQEKLNFTGRNVTVAVVDTGVDYTHPDLGGCTREEFLNGSCRVKGGFDFYFNDSDPMDDHSHGTHVAGIIGARGGITGVAPDVSFYALRVCGPGGDPVCYDSDIIAAVEWALAHDVDIISISLGGASQPNDEVSPLDEAVDAAVKRGVVVSVAAGNLGSGASTIEHPASGRNVITVGNADDKGTKSTSDDSIDGMSSRGPSAFGRLDPDVSAPGTNIYSTVPGGVYGVKSGTSMAAPHVSGAAALMLEWRRNLTPAEIRSRLMRSAENISGGVFDVGAGGINVSRAILSTLSAGVYGGDRVEVDVLPGETKFIRVSLSNLGNATRNLAFSLEDFADAKQYRVLPSSVFKLPEAVEVAAGVERTVQLNVSLPENVSPGVYGGLMVSRADTGETLRIPMVFSVPLVGGGWVFGKVTVGGGDNGDWVYIPLKPKNSNGLRLNLSFSSGDLDVFLLASNGEYVSLSNTSANPEVLSAYNLSYDTYWALVHGRSVSDAVYFNMTLDYLSNFSITPAYWAGVYGGNTREITLTITNDNQPKENIPLRVVSIRKTSPVNSTAETTLLKHARDTKNYSYTDLSCARVWLKKDLNLTLEKTRYVDVNLSWNPGHNLDLYLVFWQDDGDGVFEAGEDHATRYASTHENTLLGENAETLSHADILYYNSKYSDVGASACNPSNTNNFTGNITLSLTAYNQEDYARATVSPQTINLSAQESKNTTISFNVTGLARGEKQNLTFTAGEYAETPILLESGDPTTPILNPLEPYSRNRTIPLSWTPSTSTVDVTYYVIEYSGNTSFEEKASVNSTTTQANATVSDGLWFFRVKAVDSLGFESPWSNTVNTTVDATPPSTPQASFIITGEGDYTPSLNWTFSQDVVSGVAYYIVQVSWNESFANTSLEANTSDTSMGLHLSDGTHYARVSAVDSAGNSGNFSVPADTTVKTVFLNELTPYGSPWVELHNSRREEYNITDWVLSSSRGNKTISGEIHTRRLLLINATELSLNETEDEVILRNPYGFTADNISYAGIPEDGSIGRSIDDGGDWVYYNASTKTPGLSNYQTLSSLLTAGWNLISLPLAVIGQ